MTEELCAECGLSLWEPSEKHPEILHRFVHIHEKKKLTKVVKFLPVDWTMDDEESKQHGRITPSQELAIQMALGQIGESDGALIGDEPGYGKTAIGAEFIVRAGRERGLIIALPDTHKQWDERLAAQSDGQIRLRIMNGSAPGRLNFEAFMKHEPGIFIAGSAYLTEKDWESEPQWVDAAKTTPLWKVDKKTGELELKQLPAGHEGPLNRIRVMKSIRQNRYARIGRKPLGFVMFDEVQAIANRRGKTRQTIYSIKAAFNLAMSGTWFLNKLENMWSITRWVWPGEDADGVPYVETSHDRWKKRFLVESQIYGKNGKALETERGTSLMTVDGEKIEGEFVSTLPAYIRRENEPVPAPLVIPVDPTPQQRAQIEDLERDLMTWVLGWDGEEAPVVADLPIVLKTRLRQVAIAELSLSEDERVGFADDAASAKLTPLRYFIEQHWPNQPVMIYTDSKIGAHFIAMRMQRAGLDARAWTGDLSRPDRQKLKEAFMAGEFPYLIVTVQSFGVGLDGFQRVCNKVLWISEPQGNVAMKDQSIRRVFRPGMTLRDGGFEHATLLMNDSSDVHTFEMLLERAWMVRTAMTGGVQAA